MYWGAFGYDYMWLLTLEKTNDELRLLDLKSMVKRVVIIELWVVVTEKLYNCMYCIESLHGPTKGQHLVSFQNHWPRQVR